MNKTLVITQKFLDYLGEEKHSWKLGDVVSIIPSEDTIIDTLVIWGENDAMFVNFEELTMLTPQ